LRSSADALKADLFNGDVGACLFDLDGVLTDTASIHAEAWKQTFDAFLQKWSGAGDKRPFDKDRDYNQYVDGKPRYDGVRDFLVSRGIRLSEGDPNDSPEAMTVCGVGNSKDELFIHLLEARGVQPYPGSRALLEQVCQRGLKTAVVSSSVHTALVVEKAGLEPFLQERIDGVTRSELGLRGKPAPDTFLEAARRLGVPAARAAVFEDALAGVEAGRAGHFGMVVGVARHEPEEELRAHGATVVVDDLAELIPT
jgi:beta-phosphoglucomutase family hydrolase